MINTVNVGIAGGGQVALGGLPQRSADIPQQPVNTAPQVTLPQPSSFGTPVASTEAQLADLGRERTEALKRSIAEALPRFFYPVSDVRFTLFKDSTGQMITRFTNIISGETSQIPEPQLMNMLSGGGLGSGLVTTSA